MITNIHVYVSKIEKRISTACSKGGRVLVERKSGSFIVCVSVNSENNRKKNTQVRIQTANTERSIILIYSVFVPIRFPFSI